MVTSNRRSDRDHNDGYGLGDVQDAHTHKRPDAQAASAKGYASLEKKASSARLESQSGQAGQTAAGEQSRVRRTRSARSSSRAHADEQRSFAASKSSGSSNRAAHHNAAKHSTGRISKTSNPEAVGSHAVVKAEASEYSRSNYGSSGRKSANAGMSRGKKIVLGVVACLAVLLVGAGVAGAVWFSGITHNLRGDNNITTAAPVAGEPYYVLLLGGDSREDTQEDNRTDSIMVARIDEANKKVSLLSVPRDLRINIEGHGMCKINSAIEYGGYDTTIKEINDLLGIQINYYAFIYFSGFKDLVDQLGGVTVDVPEGTMYRGVWVPSGEDVEITGEEALVLARCRHGYPPDTGAYAMGDYQRTLNQRNLIKAIAKKILQQDVTAMAGLIESLSKCVETNMDASQIIAAATNLKGLNVEKIECAQLPICGDTVGGEWFAALYDDVFQVMKSNFVNGEKLMKGLAGFKTEMNDNDLTSDCIDGDLYAYTNYESHYGDFTQKAD